MGFGRFSHIQLDAISLSVLQKWCQANQLSMASATEVVAETKGYRIFLGRHRSRMTSNDFCRDLFLLANGERQDLKWLRRWMWWCDHFDELWDVVSAIEDSWQYCIRKAQERVFNWLPMEYYPRLNVHLILDGISCGYGRGSDYICDLVPFGDQPRSAWRMELERQLCKILHQHQLRVHFESTAYSLLDHLATPLDQYKFRLLCSIVENGLPEFLYQDSARTAWCSKGDIDSNIRDPIDIHNQLVARVRSVARQRNEVESVMIDLECLAAEGYQDCEDLGTHMCICIASTGGGDQLRQLSRSPVEFYRFFIDEAVSRDRRLRLTTRLNEIEPPDVTPQSIHICSARREVGAKALGERIIGLQTDGGRSFCVAVVNAGAFGEVSSRYPSGTAHACEHFVARKIREQIPGLLRFGALTTPTDILYFGSLSDATEVGFSDVVQLLCSPAHVGAGDLAGVIDEIRRELRIVGANPFYQLEERLHRLAFDTGFSIRGTERSVRQLTTESIQRVLSQTHTRSNLIISIATPSVDQDIDEVASAMQVAPDGVPLFCAPLPFGRTEERIDWRHLDHPVSSMSLGILIPKPESNSGWANDLELLRIRSLGIELVKSLGAGINTSTSLLETATAVLVKVNCQSALSHIGKVHKSLNRKLSRLHDFWWSASDPTEDDSGDDGRQEDRPSDFNGALELVCDTTRRAAVNERRKQWVDSNGGQYRLPQCDSATHTLLAPRQLLAGIGAEVPDGTWEE
jgi:hypothetical protein